MRYDLPSVQAGLRAGSTEFLSPSFLMTRPEVRHLERVPPDVLAAMAEAWDQVWYPPAPLRVRVFEDVFVAAEGLVLHPDGALVHETVEQHAPGDIDAARRLVLGRKRREVPRFGGDVVLCRKRGVATYGHWLIEVLPRAILASQRPGRQRYMIQAVDAAMAAVMRQTLQSIGVGAHAVVEASTAPVWVERLVHVEGLTRHGGYMSPLALDCLATISARIEPAAHEALFVVRPPGDARHLADEARLTALALESGFTVVEPSGLGFTRQVALFKGARRIVGVMGSALANLAFAESGTEVSVPTPANMPDTFFWFIGGHRGLRMTDIRCDIRGARGTSSWDAQLVLDAADLGILGPGRPSGAGAGPGLFDPEYYAANNAAVAASCPDLLDHYMTTGWREGRLPSAEFDGNAYLASHPDVRAAGLNPLFHFLRYGVREGRGGFAA